MNNQKRWLPAWATVSSVLAEGFNVAASATVGFVGWFGWLLALLARLICSLAHLLFATARGHGELCLFRLLFAAGRLLYAEREKEARRRAANRAAPGDL